MGTPMVLAHSSPLAPVARLAQLAATAVLLGAATTLVDRVLLGADPLPLPDAALVAALTAFAVPTCTWALLAGLGRLAVPVAFGLFIIVGNPSSGGAIPRALLPSAYAALSGWLPNGAAVTALRNLILFPTASVRGPVLVLAGVGGALVLTRGRPTPGPDRPDSPTAHSVPLDRT